MLKESLVFFELERNLDKLDKALTQLLNPRLFVGIYPDKPKMDYKYRKQVMKLKNIFAAPLRIYRIARGKGIDFSELPKPPKSFAQRLMDLLIWAFKYHQIQDFYYIYGFESKSRKEQDEYMAGMPYYHIVNKTNFSLLRADAGEDLDYRALTLDKFLANNYLESVAVPAVKNEALIRNNTVYWRDGEEGELSSLLKRGFGSIFVKPVYGSFGLSIMRLDTESGAFVHLGKELEERELEKLLQGQMWVVQKKIEQHHELDSINSSAVNSIRINTILKNGKPEFVTSAIKIATGDNYIDNWSAGSLAVGIDHQTGTLLEEGYYKIEGHLVGSSSRHPDTGISFKGFKIPYYFEAVDIALRAHKFFYGRFILATDVAITETGPMIIEVNCKPDLSSLQMYYGGIKSLMLEAAGKGK